MTLYDWILRHGVGVDYWERVILGVSHAWAVHDSSDGEQYSTEGLLDTPAEVEQWINGVVLPFGVLFALKNVQVPAELENYETPEQVETIRGFGYPK